MLDVSTTLLHGLVICIPFSIFAIGSFWRWPRLWLHSLPPDIVQRAGPKTETETRQTRLLRIPLLLILPGLSLASAWYLAGATQTDLSFWGALRHIYGIWLVVHIWDFVVIDGGHIWLIDPQRPPIPGTEGAPGYRDYSFYFRALVRAVMLSSLFVVPNAALMALVV